LPSNSPQPAASARSRIRQNVGGERDNRNISRCRIIEPDYRFQTRFYVDDKWVLYVRRAARRVHQAGRRQCEGQDLDRTGARGP
jgi:hypothetical protein